jgi:polyisoprenoid-binding protein YceI
MKKISIIAAIAFLGIIGLLYAFKAADKIEWKLDKAHSRLGFEVSHLTISDVDGRFKVFDANLISEKNDFSDAVVTMAAEVGTIDTDNNKRDADLKGPDYFDSAKFPMITFKSKSFKKVNDRNYKVTGDLTIRGITKTVVLNAFWRTGINPMSKAAVAGFKVTGTIKRLDFGVGASTSVAMIGDDVSIEANVEFEKVSTGITSK